MSSSDVSEALEPESSGSLETMLGFSTETGRATALTPSSSSGTQALSNPTLDSSESSRPATPPVERARPAPVPWPEPGSRQYSGPSGVRPGTAEESSAALTSDQAAHGHASAGGPPLPGQSTAALTLAPSSGEPRALGAAGWTCKSTRRPYGTPDASTANAAAARAADAAATAADAAARDDDKNAAEFRTAVSASSKTSPQLATAPATGQTAGGKFLSTM